jgi:hypothetical protein
METKEKEKVVNGLMPQEIRELKEQIEEKEQELKDLEEWEITENEYDEFLDEMQGDIDILGVTYSLSHVLKEVDKVRYNIGMVEEEDRIREEKREELETELEDLKEQLEELTEK